MTRLLLLLCLSIGLHEYHVSICEIKSTEDDKLQISWKFMTTDLNEAVKGAYPDFSIDEYEESIDAPQVGLYLIENFSITLDGEDIELDFKGLEFGYQDSWCYFESLDAIRPGEIVIKNTCLVERFSDQQNYVNWLIDEKPISHIMSKENTSVSFGLE